MFKKNIYQYVLIMTVFSFVILFTGCPDAEKAADSAFKKKGLNRIRTINDSIEAGSVILVKNGKAYYVDNMLDYNDGTLTPTINVENSNSVISNNETDKTMDGGVALDFVNSLLPINVNGKIKFTSKVNLTQIYAKTRRIKIPVLASYLTNPNSRSFRDQIKPYVDKGYKVFIGYETYQASKIKLTAEGDSDISTDAAIGKINPLIEGIKPKFSWTKNSKTELEIDGDHYYTFALRTARLNLSGSNWTIDPGQFAEPGVLGAGDTQTKPSYSPLGDNSTDYKLLDLISEKPSLD